MINWQSPVNINLEYFGVDKVIFFVLGIITYITNAGWVITRKRVFKWPFLLYVGSRFLTVFYLVCASVTTSSMDCQVLILVIYGFAYLAVALASALLALRAVAFWNNNKIVVGLAISLWLLNISFLVYGVTQGRSVWDTDSSTCVELDTTRNLRNFFVTFFTDLALLTIMLSGIWPRRKGGGLWKLVYRQGILWVAGATVGELPCIILILLDYNDPINLLLQPFSALAMVLCATKMYRELCEYAIPVTSAQYSLDISPMKVEASRSSRITDLPTISISEEFGKQPLNNMKLDLSFDYP